MKNTAKNVLFTGIEKLNLDYETVLSSYTKITEIQKGATSRKKALEVDKIIESLPVLVNTFNCRLLAKVKRKYDNSIVIKHSFGKLFITYSIELDFVNRRQESFEILAVVNKVIDELAEFGYFLSLKNSH